jgi:tetratricopeptide (TPR) repeat protein
MARHSPKNCSAIDDIKYASATKNWNMVIQYCDEFIKIDPNYVYPFYARGVAYLEKEQFDLAIIDHSESIRLDSNYVEAYFKRGCVYASNSQFDLAVHDLKEAIRLNPDFKPDVVDELAEYGIKLSDYASV